MLPDVIILRPQAEVEGGQRVPVGGGMGGVGGRVPPPDRERYGKRTSARLEAALVKCDSRLLLLGGALSRQCILQVRLLQCHIN